MLRRLARAAALLALLTLALPAVPAAQAQPIAPGAEPLTVAQIMQRPEAWVGGWPSGLHWTDRGDAVYFQWNPQGRLDADSLFRADRRGGAPALVAPAERRALAPRFAGWHADRLAYDADFRRRVAERDGDVVLYDLAADRLTRLTATREREAAPRFSPDGRRVVYRRDAGGVPNLFALDLATGATRQLTDLRRGAEPKDAAPGDQDAYLERQQTRLFDVLRERARRDSLAREARERDEAARALPPAYYVGDRAVGQLRLSPDERFATFTLAAEAAETDTRLLDYVTRSGYAEEIAARAKVGAPGTAPTLYVQDLARDTTFALDFAGLPGLADAPDYARERGAEADSARLVQPYGPYWSPDGRWAVLDVRTYDNKDRWIVRLDPASGALTVLDRQRDEAWIGGPGIAWWGGESAVGWVPARGGGYRFWFHSERTGHSHLYAADPATGAVAALTSGPYEVEEATLTRDGRTWLLQTSEGSPHERHVWRMPAEGGRRERLTEGRGRFDVALSPDSETLALLHSTGNRPPDVYLQSARPGAARRRVTESPTAAWLAAHDWRDPEIVTIPASDGVAVPARIYRPATPNGAAVLFVHGAGYLQNVHTWWSSYFREYMFHHLLAERGYVVLDLDFRASAGYGRDWRTAVYRHMGGRDLQDYVDASRWVGAEFGIAPERVALYGGSYGGFITLMALFTEPEHFGGGAALRAVTDWAHYNHPYTANILNTPAADSLAYARSSPIEFAAGLEDPLLMCHGLVDDNVQPQDIFRLSQRLIELGKEDWELAIYPVEPHGFTEPSSWTDEYRRVLDLIKHSVGPRRTAGSTEG